MIISVMLRLTYAGVDGDLFEEPIVSNCKGTGKSSGSPGTHNVVSRKQGPLVSSVVGNAQEHHTSRNRRKAKKGQDRALLLPVSGQPGASHGSNKLNCTKRNIQQNCVEGIKAK